MLDFNPTPTGAKLIESTAPVSIIMGPVGSSKSTHAAMALLKRAVEQPAFNGVRRSRGILMRNTSAQLKSTVKPLIDEWLVSRVDGALGQWRLTEGIFELRFMLPDGTRVQSDWMMLPADTPDDVRRLLSVEASFAFVEEAREINEAVFTGLRGRLNRFPNQATGGSTSPGVICSTNPPSLGTCWADWISNPPEGWDVFVQPPAVLDDGTLNPAAENLCNLPPDYYSNLMQGATTEWRDVYLGNKFGLGNLGQPVFRNTFKRSIHLSKGDLSMIAMNNYPILVGMDNGLTAAAVIGQMNARGRVNILAEAYVPEGTTMGVERFMDTILTPKLKACFPSVTNAGYIFVLDPACWQRNQVDEVTIAQAVNARGYRVMKASTNDPERRVAAVEGLLSRMVDGEPGLMLDHRCKWLADALDYGYRFKRQASGQIATSAEKNHFSHIADALQYLCLHFNGQLDSATHMFKSQARTIVRRPYTFV